MPSIHDCESGQTCPVNFPVASVQHDSGLSSGHTVNVFCKIFLQSYIELHVFLLASKSDLSEPFSALLYTQSFS